VPPWGLAGGRPGAPFRIELHRPDGTVEELRGKENRRLRRGDLVRIMTCGGGGYGPPEA
jgi:N-methylhydantoinase B